MAASALAPCFQARLGPGAAGEEAPSVRLGGWELPLTPARGLSLLSCLLGNPWLDKLFLLSSGGCECISSALMTI